MSNPKEIRQVCMELQKIYPYGKEEGCYILVPYFGEFVPEDEGGEGYSAEELQEIFQFEAGKAYRITVEEVGDERSRLKAANDWQQQQYDKMKKEEEEEKKQSEGKEEDP